MESEPVIADDLRVFVEAEARPRSPRSLPGLVARALRLVWRSSRVAFAVSATLQIVSAGAAVAQVLVAKRALDLVLRQSASGGPFSRAAPSLVALAAVDPGYRRLIGAVQSQVARLMGDQVQQRVTYDVLAVTSGVELERFDDPTFYNQLQRVLTNALLRPVAVAKAMIQFVAGLLGTVAVGAAVWTIHPILLPILAVASFPAVVLVRLQGPRNSASPWPRPSRPVDAST